MKNPTLKLLTFAITGLALSFLPNAAKAQSGQTEYFGTNNTGIVSGGSYSWDAANWALVAAGPFSDVWTNGNFARFYGGAGDSYTVTVNQAETNVGLYMGAGGGTIVTIADAGNGTGSLYVNTNTPQATQNGYNWLTQGFYNNAGIVSVTVPITGPGGVEEVSGGGGTGHLQLYGTNTFTGGFLATSSTSFIDFDNYASFGPLSNQIGFDGTTFTILENNGPPTLIISNALQTIGNCGIDFVGTNVTFSGNWYLGGGASAINIRNNGPGVANAPTTLTLSGVLSATTGTVNFSSAYACTIILDNTNTYTGPTTLGVAGDTNITLVFGVANALTNSSSITLAGGTLNGGGFNNTFSGSLGLSFPSTNYFGTGGAMSFSNSSAQVWSGVLNLADWTGGGSTFGGTQFRIGTNASGLTSAQLDDIEFDSNPSTLGVAAIDPNGYIYNAGAVPGPSFSVTTANGLISQPNTYGNSTSTTLVIARSGSLASTVTLNYILSGTALGVTNAASGFPSYTATVTGTPSLSGSIVFGPNVTSSNITITAVSDSIARPTTALAFNISPSVNYALGSPAFTNVTILNTVKDEVFATTGAVTNMYNAFSNDFATITLTRWGDTNASAFNVNTYTYSGSAIGGVDFTNPPTTINPGDQSDTAYVYPLINGQIPVHTNNLPYTGNKTISAKVATASAYTGSTNTALLTIIDDAYPPATYLFRDPMTNSADSNNWAMTYADGNMQTHTPEPDALVSFGYDLYDDFLDPDVMATYSVPIPFPPSGATNALRVTVNKGFTGSSYSSPGTGSGGSDAAVNLYATNVVLSGNYAVRFSMNLVEGYSSSYTTEGALFGINHGMQTGKGSFATNWFAAGGVSSGWGTAPGNESWEADGIWCWVDADNGIGGYEGGASSYMVFTGNGGKLPNAGFAAPLIANDSNAQFANNFKTNVFTSNAGPGISANMSPDNSGSPIQYSSWSDVELKQFDNVVTISIDKIPLCVYTNTTTFTNGYLMLGYEDPYASVGGADAAVYYSDLRVVQLTPPAVTQGVYNGSTYVFNFTTTDGDLTPASFTVVGSTSISPGAVNWTVVSGATITQLSSGAFQATVPISGAIHFYRINQQL